MTTWCSLYLPHTADLAKPLQTALQALGYERFNPFGLIPGRAYPQTVRLFVAPAAGSWTRVLASSDSPLPPELLPAVSQIVPCLWAELDGAAARIAAYAGGIAAPVDQAFALDAACIDQALKTPPASDAAPQLGGVALDALPDDVQALAQGINLKQAGKLFNRMSATLSNKTGADASAADLLRQPDWNSPGAAQIRALMTCLNIPNWREPDFVTLRDAYALHERRRRSPKATLYPGDAEALAAVPNALDYTPVYAGKR